MTSGNNYKPRISSVLLCTDKIVSFILNHFLLVCFLFFACTCVQQCPTLCDPMDCSSSGFSVHEILQARIPKWVAISSSRASSWSRNRTHISCTSCIGKQVLYPCTTKEVLLSKIQIRSDQSLSRVRLFVTPWIAARQASLSITNSQSSITFAFIESAMPSSHLILCRPLLLLPPISQHQSLFQWVNSSHEVANVLKFRL